MVKLLKLYRTFCNSRLQNFEWFPSKVIADRKSEFQGRVVKIHQKDDVEKYIELFKQEHKRILKSATHPYIYAWRVGQLHQEDNMSQMEYNGITSPETRRLRRKAEASAKNSSPVSAKHVNVQEGYFDCGEKSGGSELMRRVIHRYNVYNVLVIVTRWMNGPTIGSKRFRHIGNAGTESLRLASLIK